MAKQYTKINVTIPNEMLEILDMYAEYEGLSRSSALGFLLARGLCLESEKTNGFDFESPYDVFTDDNGDTVTIRRCDIKGLKAIDWIMSCGRNRRKEYVTVTNEDFEQDIDNPQGGK